MPFSLHHSLANASRNLIVTGLALSLASPLAAQTTGPSKRSPTQPSAAKGGQAQPQDAGPVLVQLRASPAQPEWTKVCGRDPNAKADVCYTTRDFVSDKDQPLLAVALYDTKGSRSQKTLRFVIPLGLLVQPGLRITVDQGPPTAGRYTACLPNGCFAEAEVKDSFVTALKKGTSLNISARNQVGRVVTFSIPAEGFGKAFDGPPIDPKVLEERQKQAQEEIERKSEELRKSLMSQSGSAPQAPTPGAAPAQPKP